MPINAGRRSPSLNANKVNLPSPRIPPEILDHILQLALEFMPTTSSKSFKVIAPFALASADFRFIAFRRYFRHIMVASSSASASAQERSQWDGIIKLLRSLEQRSGEECFSWIRSLRAPSKALTLDPVPLAALTHLQELSIDLEAEGLATQHSILKHLLSPITNASHNLTLLALTSLPRIDIPLLRLIADCFPYLVDLYLSCTERLDFSCCWNCCGESLGLTIHSPVPDMFSDSTDMADAFADVLTPLTQLVHLHLGIYLSDEQLLDFHLLHDELLSEILSGPEECGICEKAAHHVRLRERAASLVFAQKLKALRTIAFSSFFVNNEICNREAKLQDRARNWPPTRETDTVCRTNG